MSMKGGMDTRLAMAEVREMVAVMKKRGEIMKKKVVADLAWCAAVLLAAGNFVGAEEKAKTGDTTNQLVTPVQTLTGLDVPFKCNSEPSITNSDMVKLCDVKIGGRFVFANTYYTTTICVFERDPVTARLTYKTSFENPLKSRWHWASLYTRELADGSVMLYWYYNAGNGSGDLAWYKIDKTTGAGTMLGELKAQCKGVFLFTPDKKRILLVSNNGSTTLKIDANGVPSVESNQVKVVGTAAVLSPDSKFLYVGQKTNITVYACDLATGALTESSSVDVAGNSDDPGLSITPDGKHLYVGYTSPGYSGSKWLLNILERDSKTGALTVKSSGEPSAGMNSCNHFLFSADGKLGFFITNGQGEGYGNCPAWCVRDPATGALTFSGKGPNHRYCCMDLDPAAGNFYAGSCGQDPGGTPLAVYKTPAGKKVSK